MKYGIIGTSAIGGYYGAKLAHSEWHRCGGGCAEDVPLEIAREAGCPMPKLEMLEAELRFLEADV